VALQNVGKVKTKKSAATLPLDPQMATTLLDYRRGLDKEPKPTDWLFPSPIKIGMPLGTTARFFPPSITVTDGPFALLTVIALPRKSIFSRYVPGETRTVPQAVPAHLREANSSMVRLVLKERVN
jgi:hypothetical protein